MDYVSYLRVSTQRQGQSGLGLEAQRATTAAYEPIAEYVEVETGTGKRERPELMKAIAHCRRIGATLCIAKLDRLARNVHFVSGLMESGVEFTACDNPNANRLTIHILAAVGEDEALRISERTKAALEAYKRRGGQLGAARPECRNLTDAARRRGAQAMKKKAERARRDVLPIAESMRADGATLQSIADQLNELGHVTARGKAWNAVGVMRMLAG